jgi:hypothetical protein
MSSMMVVRCPQYHPFALMALISSFPTSLPMERPDWLARKNRLLASCSQCLPKFPTDHMPPHFYVSSVSNQARRKRDVRKSASDLLTKVAALETEAKTKKELREIQEIRSDILRYTSYGKCKIFRFLKNFEFDPITFSALSMAGTNAAIALDVTGTISC